MYVNKDSTVSNHGYNINFELLRYTKGYDGSGFLGFWVSGIF